MTAKRASGGTGGMPGDQEPQAGQTVGPSAGGASGAPAPADSAGTDDAALWQAKAQEHYQAFLRARADYDNLARRTQRDVALQLRRGKQDLFLRLLELADNLERATASWRTTLASCPGVDGEALVGGVTMIGRQLQAVLATEGLKPIEAVGCPFDPAVHECVVTWDSPAVETDTVSDELRRGYTLDGEVLRAAQVRVARPAGRG